MMNTVFLDTGGLVALSNRDHPDHLFILKSFNRLLSNGFELFTTSFVLEELVTLLRCREKIAVKEIFRFLHNLYINDLNVIEAGGDFFGDAAILMHKFEDHFFSMTDCISFVVMKKMGIKDCFTTDRHFTIAGFNNLLTQN